MSQAHLFALGVLLAWLAGIRVYLTVFGVGLAGWAGQHLITEAFRLAPAATVAPYEYLALVWGMGIDWFVWQTLPGARTIAGAAIVIAAGLYLLHRERLRPASATGP